MSTRMHESKESDSKDDGSSVNIKVVVRCRPLNSEEKGEGTPSVVTVNSVANQISVRGGSAKRPKNYSFDKVYGQYSTQEEMFTTSVIPTIHEVLQGFNCTVFAYGQTGTGKTYTMEGELGKGKHAGIIPRSIHMIFDHLKSTDTEYSVRLSFLELYNEQLEDLLLEDRPGSASSAAGAGASATPTPTKTRLRIVDDSRKGTLVHGLEEVLVHTAEEAFGHVDAAIKKRRVAETMMNKASSRSHCIFTLTIHTKETTPDGEDLLKVGKLNLVDLAGSECVGRSGATHGRAREAGNINQSLLTLGRVITALVEHTPHIPYRDSKLTRLLQDSLGGRTKTCVIATLSPSILSVDETISTLDYANRAKNIKNRPVLNQKMTKRALIKEYSLEIERLKEELKCAREKNGVFLPKERFDQIQLQLQSQSGSLAELESVLEVHSAAKEALEKQNAVIANVLNEAVEDVHALHAKIDRKAKVEETNTTESVAFVDETAVRLDELTVSLGEYRETQTSELETLGESIDGLMAHRAEETATMTASIDSIKSTIDSFVDTTLSHTEGFLVSGNTEYDALQSQVSAFNTSFPEMLKTSGDQIKTELSGMSALIQKQQQQLNEWAAFAQAFTQSLKTSTEEFVVSHSETVSAAKTTVDDTISGLKEAVSRTNEKLTEVSKARTERSRSTAAKMIEMLQEFAAKEEEANTNDTESITEITNAVSVAASTGGAAIGTQLDEVSSVVANWSAARVAEVSIHEAETTTRKDAVVEAINEGDAFRSSVASSIDTSLSQASSQVTDLMTGFSSTITDAQTRLASFTTELNTNVASARDTVTSESSTVYDTIRGGEAAFGEACEAVKTKVESGRGGIEMLAETQTQWVSKEKALHHSFVAERLIADIPTGGTPTKDKEYSVSVEAEAVSTPTPTLG